MNIDLQNLTIAQVLILTVVVTVLDVAAAYLAAVVQGKFDLGYVAAWLQTHTIKRVFPIFALALLGHGVPQAGLEGIPALFALALAGLATYLIETVKSIQVNFGDATAVRDDTPVPPAGPADK